MCAHALQAQARLVLLDDSRFGNGIDSFSTGEVATGQSIGVNKIIGGAGKDNLSAFFTGTGAHVENMIGSQHHLRIVLNHDQRVAGITKSLHDCIDAIHVPRVKTDGGLI